MLAGDVSRIRLPIPNAPQPLSDLIEKATHPATSDRFATATEMLAALEHAACHVETRAPSSESLSPVAAASSDGVTAPAAPHHEADTLLQALAVVFVFVAPCLLGLLFVLMRKGHL